MGKYDRLGDYLREQGRNQIPLTFAEVERIVGTELPKSQQHQAWWSNSTSNNVMTKVWLDAGYETAQVDVVGQKLVFRRVDGTSSYREGMSEGAREFKSAEDESVKKTGRHPLIGSMKDTFWIDPDWDLTQPTMSQEELDEMDANLDRTADLIEAGMSRKAR
jgi:hypothetical protein